MKIALICSYGGHLTQTLRLMDAFEGQEVFFITYENIITQELEHNKYLLKNIGLNPLKMFDASIKIFKILLKEKPDIIVSTGSEIAIPSIILSKLLKIKTIYIESWSRINNKSGTGRIVYYFSDVFLVQWPELLKHYGKKAQFRGSVV